MVARPLSIGIVGSGTAGPAAAILLARAGHRVQLFERAPALRAVGAGFLLQPTGLAVAAELGLTDLVQGLSPVRRLLCRTAGGRTLLDLAYEKLKPGICGYGVHRPFLLERLVSRMREVGATLTIGCEVERITQSTSSAQLYDSAGSALGAFDLVVLADGARSRLREQIWPRARMRPYPWGALWFIGREPEGSLSQTLYQVVAGTDTMVGFLPSGRVAINTGNLVSLFWSVETSAVDALRRGGISQWKERIWRLTPHASGLLEQVEDFDQLTVAQYYDVRLPAWHTGRVVAIGDAGHAMSPQLGQGVNLGFLDAHVLATSLSQQASVEDALASFSRSRRHQLQYYQLVTRWLTPFFQSSMAPLGLARDFILPLLNVCPPTQQQMLRTMAGLKRGILRRSMSLTGP